MVEGVGGELHEDFAGEGVAPHVQVGDRRGELVGVVASSETDQEPLEHLDAVLVGGPINVNTLRNC